MAKTILVVDDYSMMRKMVREILVFEDYDVIEAEDALGALSIIEKQTINLLITDIMMPGINGDELAAKARKLNPDMKILGMTGGSKSSNDNGIIGSYSPSLFDTVLNKPFRTEQLLAVVAKCLLGT
jgi:CheY-like chemotaxis protein